MAPGKQRKLAAATATEQAETKLRPSRQQQQQQQPKKRGSGDNDDDEQLFPTLEGAFDKEDDEDEEAEDDDEEIDEDDDEFDEFDDQDEDEDEDDLPEEGAAEEVGEEKDTQNGAATLLEVAPPKSSIGKGISWQGEDSDDDDEGPIRRSIGNIPIEWYDEYPHIGYDLDGNKIMKPAKGDELEKFLTKLDSKDGWKTVRDKDEMRDVVLTDEELDIIHRIQRGMYADAGYDPFEPTIEWFTSQKMIHPVTNAPEPKSRFVPSKWEAQKVMKIVRAIRAGLIKPKRTNVEKPRYYSLWDAKDEPQQDSVMHIPAPRMRLPEHSESYNPPVEYLPTPEEIKEWEKMDSSDRPLNYIPKRFSNLRSVPAYDRFVQERFERCLDLYLCPRVKKNRLNIDPESLIPKLPSPKELQPFPSTLSIVYKGHTDKVRCFAADPSGQYLISGSDDKTLRCWEVATGKCLRTWSLSDAPVAMAWNPNKAVSVVAVIAGKNALLFNPGVGSHEVQLNTNSLLSMPPANNAIIDWRTGDISSKAASGRVVRHKAITLAHKKILCHVAWHRKGDYFSTVADDGTSQAVLVHQLSRHASQNPFQKSKGLVQRVLFHPTKPLFFVATQRYVRVYNLQKQELTKKLETGCKWISSMDIHPQGDNVIIGSHDSKLCWFDLDLSSRPYKSLRYNNFAVRSVSFHKHYPLFASCSDNGSVHIFHGMVYSDLMMNPLIVPVKILRAHDTVQNMGAIHCEFHPTEPWVFSSGADGTIKLFT